VVRSGKHWDISCSVSSATILGPDMKAIEQASKKAIWQEEKKPLE